MRSGFNDPIVDRPTKQKKEAPWDFRSPQYDERSSCFVNAGTHHGVGYTNPVGHEGNPKMRVPTMPFGRVNTMEVDEAPNRQLPMVTEQ